MTADGPVTRAVRVRAIDKDGGSNVYTATVTVNNVAPTGALTDRTVNEGQTATFGLTNLADPGDLATVRYVYDFDGNGTDDTAAVTYANASNATTADVPAALTADGPATRNVRVRVSTRTPASNAYTAPLTVTNVAPDGTLANSGPVNEGAIASLVGRRDRFVEPPTRWGPRYTYDLDNDGTYDIGRSNYATASPLTAIDVPASFTADGHDTVTVRAASSTRTAAPRLHADVDVDNVAPTATLTGAAVNEGSPATVAFSAQADASAADTAAGFAYEYDLDDDGTFDPGGATATLPAALTADGPATLDVHAAIIDRDGGRREYDTTVTVANVAPTAAVTGPVGGAVVRRRLGRGRARRRLAPPTR